MANIMVVECLTGVLSRARVDISCFGYDCDNKLIGEERMEYMYFPGCTLKNKAKDLDAYARVSAEALGFTLKEIPEWQCCGAVYPLAKDEVATKLSCVRALAVAEKEGLPLVTLCSACYNVLKQVNDEVQNDADFRAKVNRYLAEDDIEYSGGAKVMHYLEVLRDDIGWAKVKEIIASRGANGELKGKKLGAYYGCLLLRPSKILHFDDPENPSIIENFISSIGATPVIYAQRNECCGAYNDLGGADGKAPCANGGNGECEGGVLSATTKRVRSIVSTAASMGAQSLVTSCPLCKYNIEKNLCKDACLNVRYFSEVLVDSLGLKSEAQKLLNGGDYYA